MATGVRGLRESRLGAGWRTIMALCSRGHIGVSGATVFCQQNLRAPGGDAGVSRKRVRRARQIGRRGEACRIVAGSDSRLYASGLGKRLMRGHCPAAKERAEGLRAEQVCSHRRRSVPLCEQPSRQNTVCAGGKRVASVLTLDGSEAAGAEYESPISVFVPYISEAKEHDTKGENRGSTKGRTFT